MTTETEHISKTNGSESAAPDTGQSLNVLFASIAKAQAKISAVTKEGKNPHFRSSYVTLDSILNGPVKVFNECGIAVVQMPSMVDDRVNIRTVLAHSSGASIQSDLSLPCEIGNPHKVGSTITYLRRFSLSSILGIAGESDDDGNAAAGVAQKPVATRRKPVTTARKVPGNKPKFQLDL